MLKLTIAIVAVALAGAAAASGWRSTRIDASSDAAFEQSLTALHKELSRARRYVFRAALEDVWVQGEQQAKAEQREYTKDEFYRDLHGLAYDEVVTLTDPTGRTAKDRYRTASLSRGYYPTAARDNWNQGGAPQHNDNQVRGLTSQSLYGTAQSRQDCSCMFPPNP
jgi:hypothetical protein